MNAVIEIEGLRKSFTTLRGGRRTALAGFDMLVESGQVHGFLGPNGSGKTTTLRSLLGLVHADGGRMAVLGQPAPERLPAVADRLGAIVESPQFFGNFTGRRTLRLLAVAGGVPAGRVDEALEKVGLRDRADERVKGYSLGMRQRLAVGSALLKRPDLLILDEPTNGLDPQGTREVRALITALAAEGTTVLLSTHLLSEVEQVCTHVGVMHRGRLVAQAPLEELQTRTTPRARVRTDRPDGAAQVLRELGLTEVTIGASEVVGLLGPVVPEKVVAALVHAAVPVRGFEVLVPGLEDLFVALTGEGFDVSG